MEVQGLLINGAILRVEYYDPLRNSTGISAEKLEEIKKDYSIDVPPNYEFTLSYSLMFGSYARRDGSNSRTIWYVRWIEHPVDESSGVLRLDESITDTPALGTFLEHYGLQLQTGLFLLN